MKIRYSAIYSALILTISLSIISCGGGSETPSDEPTNKNVSDVVISHELSDAQMLNPINYSDAGAGYIIKNIFYTLLSIDFNTLELVPLVAESRPEIEVTEDNKMNITYRLRKEATWDDGTPITPKDVEFTLKVIKNPKVDNVNNKPYFEFIEDMVFYDDDPQKFTFKCKDVYILAEVQSGDLPLLPRNVYDPNDLMGEFTIKQLTENQSELANNEKIIDIRSMSKEQAVDAAVIARNLLGNVALAADMADGSHIWEHSFVSDFPPGLVIKAKKVDDALTAIDGPVLTWLVDTPNHPGLSAVDILQGRLPEGTEVRPSGLGTPEIVLVGVSKASGLALISDAHSIDSTEVMAFGDGLNDLEMLKWAGRSIAMANGHQLALDLATEIAPPNDADGVAEVLESLLAEKKLGN